MKLVLLFWHFVFLQPVVAASAGQTRSEGNGKGASKTDDEEGRKDEDSITTGAGHF